MATQHNPYAAPAAPAVEATAPGRLVRIAVGLYVASFVLTLPASATGVLVPEPEMESATRRVVAISITVTVVLMGLVTAFISHRLLHRSRGARGWLIGFTPVWILFLFWPGMAWSEIDWQTGADTLGTLLRIAAGLMVCLPAAGRWFASSDREPGQAPDFASPPE